MALAARATGHRYRRRGCGSRSVGHARGNQETHEDTSRRAKRVVDDVSPVPEHVTRDNWLRSRLIPALPRDRSGGELFLAPIEMRYPYLHWDRRAGPSSLHPRRLVAHHAVTDAVHLDRRQAGQRQQLDSRPA